jgi:pseudouridine-5'-phosphate glycosidase
VESNFAGLRDRIVFGDEVSEAMAAGRPLVALESTLISHGLPWPDNRDVATRAEAAVRESGATPATVAIHAGRIHVGLTVDEIDALASAPPGSVAKASRPTLAAALATPGWAGTTVSATMITADAVRIPIFATGGIGGVHRGALDGSPPSFDISSDLEELARTEVVVVCAGPKAILDVRATIEYLETRGVPVVTLGSDQVPGFFSRESSVASPAAVPTVEAAAGLVRTHFALGLGAGLLLCVPVPEGDALPADRARQAIDGAIVEAQRRGVTGAQLTPWLLARIAKLTDGASVRANTALIVNNARVAGRLAAELAGGP